MLMPDNIISYVDTIKVTNIVHNRSLSQRGYHALVFNIKESVMLCPFSVLLKKQYETLMSEIFQIVILNRY